MTKVRLFTVLGVAVLAFGFAQLKEAKAGTGDNVSGWAWSENIGWISFNSTNCDTDGDGTYEGAAEAGGAAPAGCPTSGTVQSYGMNINPATGAFSGYAWSENIGWVTFNAAELAGCPSGTCSATLNLATKQASGWAKALALGSNGWIHLKGTGYGVVWDPPDNQELKNWAWSDSFGWISFNCKNEGVCGSSNYQVVAPINEPPTSTLYRDQNGGPGFDPVCDQDNCPEKLADNWKNANFARYVFDDDIDGTVASCTWMATNLAETSRVPCADSSFNPLTVTVGATGACATQGVNACVVFVRNTDNNGATAEYGVATYNADWTDPVIQNNPSFVQSENTGTFSVTASDNVELNYCWLYDATSGTSYSLDFYQNACNQGGELSACPGGTNCKACRDMNFSLIQGHTLQVICSDQYDMETSLLTGSQTYLNTTSLGISSLFATLSAVPPSGSVNTLFDLVGTVSGDMTGNIDYKFDCTNNGTWELEVNNSNQNPYTAVDLCQYPSPGTYIAKVFVQRSVGTTEDTVSVSVASNSIPTTTNRLVDAPNSVDYCGVTGYPPVRVRWTFSDADPGDTQGAYQIQVFHGGNTVVDTGKKSGATQSYVFQSPGEQLLWNRTYTWQVRVWDSPNDDASSFASGPQFNTPKHHYPVPNFTWTPALPGAQESVQFTDTTNFAAGSQSKTWSWNFADPDSGVNNTSTSQNPSHSFTKTGAFGVTLQGEDDVGSCSSSQTVNVSVPFPEWQEISPF